MNSKTLKTITQILLLAVIAIVPFLKTISLYFPYISGKVYLFRTLVALAFFFWIWLMIQESRNKKQETRNVFSIFKNILVIALALFFLAQVLVSFLGVDPLLSFFSTMERADGVLQYGFWLLYFLMMISIFKKEEDWKLFFYVFIIVAVLSSIYSWYLFNFEEEVIRVHALFGNSSFFAVFLLFGIGFCAIAIERRFLDNRALNDSLFSLAAVIFTITLIFTQTRGAYFGLTGGIFLFCLLVFLFLRGDEDKSSSSPLAVARVKENKKFALFSGIFLAIGLISVIILFLAKDTKFVQNTYILKRTTSVANLWQDDTARERFLVWQMAWKGFKDRPIFGWGPENFWSASNKYYDYRVGMTEPWFDRAHSQPIDILTTGGIVLFSFYLFWLAAAIYTILKIAREKKILSFILASIFLAYFLQGLFLFDILPTFLGLFPFLAFLVFASRKTQMNTDEKQIYTDKNLRPSVFQSVFIGVVGLFSLFIIWATVFLPYKANVLALKFSLYLENGTYEKAKPFLEQFYNIKSPYTFWEARKRSAWELANILGHEVNAKTIPKDLDALKDIYDYITPELEKFVENKPYDPQIYYVLGKTYLLGFEKLGKNDLDKAETVLKKGLNYSDSRLEYYNELVQVFAFEEKFDEGESLITDYSKKLSSGNMPGDDYYNYNNVILGNFYFLERKNDLAWEYYEKARENGYQFVKNELEYSHYAFLLEQRGEYQKIVDLSLTYLDSLGPDADIFYNVAVGYLNLREKEKSKEFFLKALELDKKYEEYRSFFEN